MKNRIQNQRGFTLIELMIVIAIVGLLASVALPQYKQYMKSAAYVELKMAAGTIAKQIGGCYELNGGSGPGNACNIIPAAGTTALRNQVTQAVLDRAANGRLVDSIALTPGPIPIITVSPDNRDGFAPADIYVLTGVLNPGGDAIVRWNESGLGCQKGFC